MSRPVADPTKQPSATSRPWTPIRPSAADLTREAGDVLADVPRFLTAPLLRPWHRAWGATKGEVAKLSMPGDDLLPDAPYRCTRAITVAAPPEEVWPWLVQAGCLRAGWYADDLLDDLGHPSARTIVPELQDLHVGMRLPMAPTPTETTTFVVDSFEAPCWMLWRTPASTWAWRLVRLPGGRTRLVTRLHTAYQGPPAARALGVFLMEFGDFPMMRRMLRGIRERAEADHRRGRFAGGTRQPTPGARRVAVAAAVATGVGILVSAGLRRRTGTRPGGGAARRGPARRRRTPRRPAAARRRCG